jgi:glycosyltransferase involved in cell wall biosynthesis
MYIVCNVALGNSQVYNHLLAISKLEIVDKIIILRHKMIDENQKIPKAEYILVSNNKFLRFLQMFFINFYYALTKKVDWFVSFNPFPYGFIAWLPAKLCNIQIHFGFIGADWYKNMHGFYSKFILHFVKHVNAITVTGPKMEKELIGRGIIPNKTSILPHSIDIDKYKINTPEQCIYDCIFVGQFIKRKQIDIICKAFVIVVKKQPDAKLCLVGEGPELESIKKLIDELNLQDNVVCTGYTTEVFKYLQQSKIMIMASLMEGFPFSIIEAICSGLVIVTTPAGTIEDLINHSKNGYIFPYKNYKKCAEYVARILNDKNLYSKIRSESLKLRNEYAYETATEVWRKILI